MVHRIFHSKNDWLFVVYQFFPTRGSDIWKCNFDVQDVKGLITSAFCMNVLTEWSKIHYVNPINKQDVLAMCVWYNSDIHINSSPVYYPTWHKNGVFHLSDLLNEQGCFYMYEQFCA